MTFKTDGKKSMWVSVPVTIEGISTQWILFSEVDYDFFIKPIKDMSYNTIKLSILSLLMALAVIVAVVALSISKPIRMID